MPPRQADWWCNNCSFTVFGSKPSCSKCGSKNPNSTNNNNNNNVNNTTTTNNRPADWKCNQCNFVVFGSKPSCSKCGSKNPNLATVATASTTSSSSAPPPPPQQQQQPQQQQWFCSSCQSLTNGGNSSCENCGQPNPNIVAATTIAAAKQQQHQQQQQNNNANNKNGDDDDNTSNTGSAATSQGRVQRGGGARQPTRTPDWFCPKCKFSVFGSKSACSKCGSKNPYLTEEGNVNNNLSGGAATSTTTTAPTTNQQRLPDWDCPTCKNLVFGSRPACRKCGFPNPGLQKQTESVLIAEKQQSKKLVEELASQLEIAKKAIGNNKKNDGNDDDSENKTNENADKVISAAAAKLEELMARINSAQNRLEVAEQAAAAGPSSIQVTPPPHWDEVSPVFPTIGFKKIDITNQPVDPENGIMTTYKAAIEEFFQMAARNEATGGSTLSNYSRVKKVERIQNDRLWVYYCSNRSLMRPSPALIPGTSTVLPEESAYTDTSKDIFRQFISQRSYGLRRQVNETILFHGTSAIASNIICDQGFDERVCNLSGLFGAGLYTASNPCKAFGYIQKNLATNTGFAFLARVCLGNPHKIEAKSDSSLRRPPNACDSVIGTPSRGAAREFIVYDRRQTYPEYLLELE